VVKKLLLIILIVFFILLVLLFVAELFLKDKSANFYAAPTIFCKTRFTGITLPPVGIFLCPEALNNINTKAHELVHWDQYQQNGSLGFYIKYAWGWVSSGFSYQDNLMEQEARQHSREFLDLVPE
jgi:hypothetical protein